MPDDGQTEAPADVLGRAEPLIPELNQGRQTEPGQGAEETSQHEDVAGVGLDLYAGAGRRKELRVKPGRLGREIAFVQAANDGVVKLLGARQATSKLAVLDLVIDQGLG